MSSATLLSTLSTIFYLGPLSFGVAKHFFLKFLAHIPKTVCLLQEIANFLLKWEADCSSPPPPPSHCTLPCSYTIPQHTMLRTLKLWQNTHPKFPCSSLLTYYFSAYVLWLVHNGYKFLFMAVLIINSYKLRASFSESHLYCSFYLSSCVTYSTILSL